MELIFEMIATYGFPIVISIYLIYKLEYFLNQMVKTNKDLAEIIAKEIREMKTAIVDLRIQFSKK